MTLTLPTGFEPGKRGDCGIVALAVITGAQYAAVWDWFRANWPAGRGPRWRGTTYHSEYVKCAAKFGTRLHRMRFRKPLLTVVNWADRHTVAGRTYLVRVNGHVGIIKDGLWLDNGRAGKPVPVGECRSARCRVTDAWLVLNKGERVPK